MFQHGHTDFRPGSRLPPLESDLYAPQHELAESRRQFASVLKSLSGLFYRCELQAPWRMSFVSEGVEGLTGYDAGELLLQDGWSNIMRVEDRSTVESVVAEAVAERRSFDVAYRIVRKTGEVRWVSERGHAVYNEEGKPLFLEGIITDISGRKVRPRCWVVLGLLHLPPPFEAPLASLFPKLLLVKRRALQLRSRNRRASGGGTSWWLQSAVRMLN